MILSGVLEDELALVRVDILQLHQLRLPAKVLLYIANQLRIADNLLEGQVVVRNRTLLESNFISPLDLV